MDFFDRCTLLNRKQLDISVKQEISPVIVIVNINKG